MSCNVVTSCDRVLIAVPLFFTIPASISPALRHVLPLEVKSDGLVAVLELRFPH